MRVKTLLLLLSVGCLVYFYYLHEERESVSVGEIAPAVTLPSHQGVVRLSDLRNKVVLLNFWASWCPACQAEMPSLEKLNRIMSGQPFKTLAISVDDDWRAVDLFTKKTPLSITVLLDSSGKSATRYGAFRLPETYLINKQGVIVQKYVGPREWTDSSLVVEILRYVGAP